MLGTKLTKNPSIAELQLKNAIEVKTMIDG